MVYTSEHRSLAALETLVHVPRVQLLRDTYVMIEARIPDELVLELDPDDLPPGWHDPEDERAAQAIGDAWLREGASVALRVPSAVLPAESNLLLSAEHPYWERVEIGAAEAFLFDRRLAER